MVTLDFNSLTIGDRIVRTKGFFLTGHHVLYEGIRNGVPCVAENQIGYGVRSIPLHQCLSEGKLIRVEYNNYNQYAQNLIIERINNRRGRSYSLLNYNCEQFVNDVLTGVATSKQIQAIGFLTVALGIYGACRAIKNSKSIAL